MNQLRDNVFCMVEEPGDQTRYCHVFQFSWNRRQVVVTEHHFDHGCTLFHHKTEVFYFKTLANIGKKIEKMSREDMLKFLSENDYISVLMKDENLNTIGSVCRCLHRLNVVFEKERG